MAKDLHPGACEAAYIAAAYGPERFPRIHDELWDNYAKVKRNPEFRRELARRYIVAPDSIRYPHVFLITGQRSSVELELFGPEAPLTVANFLALVDRHFFDDNVWHRVVPNFVVQDGDRRGDGGRRHAGREQVPEEGEPRGRDRRT